MLWLLLGYQAYVGADELSDLAARFQAESAVGRYAQAEATARRGLAVAERSRNAAMIAAWQWIAGNALFQNGKAAEASQLMERALSWARESEGETSQNVAAIMNDLAVAYDAQDRYADAEVLHKRALAIREKLLGTQHAAVADSLIGLANLYESMGRYADAEPHYKRALAICEAVEGREHARVALVANNLAYLYQTLGRYTAAEALYARALAIRQKTLGAEHPDVAQTLHNLALVNESQGRIGEAEELYKRSMAIFEKAFGGDSAQLAAGIGNLAMLYQARGRYAEAEPLYKRSLAIFEKVGGSDHRKVAQALDNLAVSYAFLGRYAEAEPLYKRALAIREKALGPDHPDVAYSLNNLAAFYDWQGRYAEAEPLYVRALALREKAFGVDHPDVAYVLSNLANLFYLTGRYSEAEPLHARALRIREQALGAEHPDTADSTSRIARLLYAQGRLEAALPMADRAIAVRDRAMVAPQVRANSYALRARIAWKLDRRAQAVDDLELAMRLAETHRGSATGGERERATSFEQLAYIFEQMVDWQCTLNDVGKALEAMELARARSLIDEMNAASVDLMVGLSSDQRTQIQRTEAQLTARVKQAEARLQSVVSASERNDARRAEALDALAEARRALYEHWRDQRTSSPTYRRLLEADTAVPALDQIRRRLAGSDGLVLLYLLGEENGYVLIVSANEARIERLAVDDLAAAILGVDAGPLVARRMELALVNGGGTGILQRLARPSTATAAAPQLAALWKAVIPERERQAIVEGRYKRLIVVPDAALALLPFETLVVDSPGGISPTGARYLIDLNVPIAYAPSTTIMMNVMDRSANHADSNMPVLSVCDPVYGGSGSSRAPETLLAMTSARSRYATVGGALAPLPFSGVESSWIKAVLDAAGLKTGRLARTSATEAAVRAAVPRRQIVHLACHGLTDNEYGNFFGALALTPGTQAAIDPRDDGYLTLAEIYELDLKSCELAILSACETNYGPQQKGEGTWALSRGFFVAGARRVVASNWLVDDEAAASLVSYFCGGVANAQKRDQMPDYAQSLHEAKRWVRQQEKWSAPYYWGTFVLVGPN